jgi:hypothetical protein
MNSYDRPVPGGVAVQPTEGDPGALDWLIRWFNPGGDIARLRQHEAACIALATAVEAARQELGIAGRSAAASFQGAAAAALTANVADLDGHLRQVDDHLRTAAQALHSQAAVKEEQLRQAHNLWIMTALVAATVGVEAGLALSMAALDAAAIGAVEAASGAAGLMGRALHGARGLLPKAVKAQGLYSAAYLGAQYISKALESGDFRHPSSWGPAWLDALDPNNYSASDAATVLMGGILYPPAFQGVMKGLGILDRGVNSIAGEALVGLTSKAAVAGLGAFWLGGKSPDDLGAWGEIGVAAGLGGVGGGAAGRWGGGLVDRISQTSAGRVFDQIVGGSGVRPEDFARRVFNAPSDIAVAVGAAPGTPPPPPAITTDDLTAPTEPVFQPPPPTGQSAGMPPAESQAPEAVPPTLWAGNVQAHQSELNLLQNRLLAHGLPARVGASWNETKGLIGWFKAGHGRWTGPDSANDHAVDAVTWRALLAPPTSGR